MSSEDRPAHARRPSHEFEDIPTSSSKLPFDAPKPRQRVVSTPSPAPPPSITTPVSAGPGRTSFPTSASSHQRNISISDTASSPFRSSFSFNQSTSQSSLGSINPPNSSDSFTQTAIPPSHHARRHSRIHSRNLSIYFPRPGSNQTPAIAEDGAQEIEAPVAIIPSSSSGLSHGGSARSLNTPLSATFSPVRGPPSASSRRLGEGFTFGKKPPPTSPLSALPLEEEANSTTSITQSISGSGASTRRGHHHRHSLSHNFFSFMEPSPSLQLQTQFQPSPSTASSNFPTSPSNGQAYPASPSWGPISPIPPSASAASTAFPPAELLAAKPVSKLSLGGLPEPSTLRPSGLFKKIASLPQSLQQKLAYALAEFIVGGLLWVFGQQSGSLACTGLGYWVVFDSFGVAIGVYGDIVQKGGHQSVRQPYGSQRMETVVMFAQAIYLLFSAVYVCKETMEHLLLSAGDGHHHHRTDEYEKFMVGLEFPTTLLWIGGAMTIASSILYGNHGKLLDSTGNFVPTVSAMIRSLTVTTSNKTSPIPTLTNNPFTLAPIGFTILVLIVGSFVSVDQHRAADLFLAAIEALITFWVSYPACVSLGKVLLQTAPERGMPGNQMENLLRVMREIERHPNVLHLPAPHVWQLTPASHTGTKYTRVEKDDGLINGNGSQISPTNSLNGYENGFKRGGYGGSPSLIVTVELHVSKSLEDVECLELTRWAWERCVRVLGQGEDGVTVSIVRG